MVWCACVVVWCDVYLLRLCFASLVHPFQEKSPQFCVSSCHLSGKRVAGRGGLSDSEDRLRKARLRSGYHSDTAAGHNSRRGAGYASDGGSYKSHSK